jgi:hypothetical protein
MVSVSAKKVKKNISCLCTFKPLGWYGFLLGFPPSDALLIIVSVGKRYNYIEIRVIRERTMLLSEVNKEIADQGLRDCRGAA